MRCKNHLRSSIQLLLIILFFAASAFPQKPRIGEYAPEIALEKVVSPSTASIPTLAGLRGKIVILEFWGVWCPHCVENIPHLNELIKKFGSRGVEILSISDDREQVVRDFLKEIEILGTVAIDTDASAITQYGVIGFPTTFIIGRDGKLLAETQPSNIFEDTIEDALNDRQLRLGTSKAEFSTKPVPEPLFEVWIRLSMSDQLKGSFGPHRVEALALPPKVCLSWAYGVPENRVILETTLPDEKYDMKAEGAPKDKNTLPALRLALESVLGVIVAREERDLDVYVLAQIPGESHKLQKPGPERTAAGTRPDRVSGTNSDLSVLVRFLDRFTGIPVLDETDLKEKYTFDLKTGTSDFESLRQAVREQLGLDLRKERRTISVLVVRKTKEEKKN